MNVPDKLTYNEAVTRDYYNHDYITVSECFPAYLYPTQSNKYLNITRSREYCDIIDKDNAPRAIAYYQVSLQAKNKAKSSHSKCTQKVHENWKTPAFYAIIEVDKSGIGCGKNEL